MATFAQLRLPHLHATGRPRFLTWRLHGSLPPDRPFQIHITSGRAFATMDRILDNASTGPLYLRAPEIADLGVKSILYREPALNHGQLHAYIVMANHVHLLTTPRVAVSKAMRYSPAGRPSQCLRNRRW